MPWQTAGDFPTPPDFSAMPKNAHSQVVCHQKDFQDKCTIQCDTGYTNSQPKTTLKLNQAEFTCDAGPDTCNSYQKPAFVLARRFDMQQCVFPCIILSYCNHHQKKLSRAEMTWCCLRACILQRSAVVNLQQTPPHRWGPGGPPNGNRCIQRSGLQDTKKNPYSGTCVRLDASPDFTSTQTTRAIVGCRWSTPAKHLPPTWEPLAHGRGQNQTQHRSAVR